MITSDLGERQPERHQDGAVNEVLDLHAGAGPHAEDVPRRGPALAFGDEVDPVLFDLERIVDVRLVNDGQILGNRHRQYLLVVASARARTPRGATEGWAVAPATPRQPPSVSRPRTHLSGPGARPWRATEGVVGPHNVGRQAPWSSGSCERCVNQLDRGWDGPGRSGRTGRCRTCSVAAATNHTPEITSNRHPTFAGVTPVSWLIASTQGSHPGGGVSFVTGVAGSCSSAWRGTSSEVREEFARSGDLVPGGTGYQRGTPTSVTMTG